jgi:hypothetical protein
MARNTALADGAKLSRGPSLAAAGLIDFPLLGHDAIHALAFGPGPARREVCSDWLIVMSANPRLVEAKGG